MADRAVVLMSQVRQLDLIDRAAADLFWEHGTRREVAAEMRRLLAMARVAPAWPDRTDHGLGMDPWAALAADRRLTFCVIDGLPNLGRYYAGPHVIVMRPDLEPTQRNVTLWHELIHAERGHAGTISVEEHEDVQREACRRAGVSIVDFPYLGGARG